MAIQKYETLTARIDAYKGVIFGHAIGVEVLQKTPQQHTLPKNSSKTLVLRSYVPHGATVAAPNTFSISVQNHITQEGVTPDAETILARDVSMVMDQLAVLYAFTDQQYDMYEDDLQDAMKEQTGERTGLVREMYLWGVMKACTNKFYSGGNSRATVDGKITPKFLSKITRSLKANHGAMITKAMGPSVNYSTYAVEPAYVCYCHTDCEQEIRDLPNFVPVVEYGKQHDFVDPHEIGCWRNIRFVLSPELTAYTDSGGAVSGLGLKSTTGTSADVYPVVIMAKDAVGMAKLRGVDSMDAIYVPLKSTSSDPLAQRGYIGSKWYMTAAIQNSGWLAVAEVAVSDQED